jgi:uncharacterized protein (TIGR02145 family)
MLEDKKSEDREEIYGQEYCIKEMPDGKIWMAENLNFNTGEGSLCYKNGKSNGVKYGRLYTWDKAKEINDKAEELSKEANELRSKQWRLPTKEDWDNLIEAVGGSKIAGKKLKAKNGWKDNGNGTDEHGFSALPGRYYTSLVEEFYGDGDGFWWTNTEYGEKFMIYHVSMGFGHDEAKVIPIGQSAWLSIRLIRNA